MSNFTRWNDEMTDYLRQNYGWIGDTQLAKMFDQQFPKSFPWTNKHIEKRRWHLKLKRTPEQIYYIRGKNNGDGRHKKCWDTRGRMHEGEVRQWDGRKYIRIDGQTILYARHVTNAKPGEIARQFPDGIRIISKRENALLNAQIRKSKTPELKQAIKLINKLTKVIHAKQTNRPQRSPL